MRREYSFDACLAHLTNHHASPSRRSTISTHDTEMFPQTRRSASFFNSPILPAVDQTAVVVA